MKYKSIYIALLLWTLYNFNNDQLSKLKVINYVDRNNVNFLFNNKEESIIFVAFYLLEDLTDKDINEINILNEAIIEIQNKYYYDVHLFMYNDSEIPTDIIKKYHLFKYTLPKIKMIKNGKISNYNGVVKKYSIIAYIKREYRDFALLFENIKLKEDIKIIINKFDEIIVYYGDKDNKYFIKFMEYSKKFKNIKFYYSNSDEVLQEIHNNINKSLLELQKSKPYIYYLSRNVGTATEINIILHEEFLNLKQYLVNFRRKRLISIPGSMMQKFLKPDEEMLILVSDGIYKKETDEVCRELNTISCAFFNKNIPEFSALKKYLDHSDNDDTIYILNPKHAPYNRPFKYKLNGFINKNNIKQFIFDYKNNNVPPFLRSAEEVDNKYNIVYEFVAVNILNYLESENKDILLMIYNSKSDPVDELKIDYLKAAKYMEKHYPKIPVRLAMIDEQFNELPFEVFEFPFFYIYSRKNINIPKVALFQRSFEGLIDFLLKKLPYYSELDNNIEF